jgi:hypothetical protein
MKKTKEYKELYISADEYYIMDDDIDDIDNNLEKPFINNIINHNNNDNNNDNDNDNNDNNSDNDNNNSDSEEDQINEFNKITEMNENKMKTCEIGMITEKITENTKNNIKITSDKSTNTELLSFTQQRDLSNNILISSINSDSGCGRIFKCACVIS